jgi:hypothetical protein
MIILARFFSPSDLLWLPLCLGVLFYILKNRANRNTDPKIRQLYFRAFYFKLIVVILFTLLTEFYFKGGDTSLFYQATKDLRAAIADNPDNLWVALKTNKLIIKSPLFDYFYYDNYEYDLTWNYMISAANFYPAKLALIPSFIFGNSYLCINMCFGFFALGGAIRLFKTFYYFYPKMYRELALACLFLPGVAFWSAGLLKDPVTFGCIGYITHAILNIFIKKKNILFSLAWLLIGGLLIYFIKVYILLVFLMSLLIWLFAEFNKLVENTTLRTFFAGMTLMASIVVAFLLLNYFTSLEAAQQFQLDNIVGNAEYQRKMYADIALNKNDSHFEINTSNPALTALGGIVATFYRPFPWEVNSPIILLSAIESFAFLILSLNFIFKKGIKKFFSVPFSDPRILMCFVFAFAFAAAIGTATANFGALSRYKIPCMPFYLIMILLMYWKMNLPYPKWFNKILDLVIPPTSGNR